MLSRMSVPPKEGDGRGNFSLLHTMLSLWKSPLFALYRPLISDSYWWLLLLACQLSMMVQSADISPTALLPSRTLPRRVSLTLSLLHSSITSANDCHWHCRYTSRSGRTPLLSDTIVNLCLCSEGAKVMSSPELITIQSLEVLKVPQRTFTRVWQSNQPMFSVSVC